MGAQNQHIIAAFDIAGNEDPNFSDHDTLALETCKYCNTKIPFNDLETATCENGHNFRMSEHIVVGFKLSPRYRAMSTQLFGNNDSRDNEMLRNLR
jgi:hypothetical protein